MKKILLDVPAEDGGATTILNEYYQKAIDSKDEWTFILGRYTLEETNNIKVINYPWVKYSWFHRLFFDYIILPKLVRQLQPDLIFSLQNTAVPFVKYPQELYIHQPIPFTDHKFKIYKNFKFWVYQNLIGKLILNSVNKSSKVYVQTEWMKRAILEKSKISSDKVEIVKPHVLADSKSEFILNEQTTKTFFFPASAYVYKNHDVILQATKKIIEQNKIDFSVIFTLSGDENTYSKELYEYSKQHGLPIHFVGYLNSHAVDKLYTESILLFPSYIETFGLPLLESKLKYGYIVAADTEFAREILKDYENKKLFKYNDVDALAKIMINILGMFNK